MITNNIVEEVKSKFMMQSLRNNVERTVGSKYFVHASVDLMYTVYSSSGQTL